MLEWVPAGLNTGALSGAKASSSRTRDILASRYSYELHNLLSPTTGARMRILVASWLGRVL
jgi:hypothetical protein